jgi:hypothetical protein
MGEFKFRLPADWELESRQAKSIHVIGLDGIPWPCRVSENGKVLSILRNRDESGKVFIAYPFAEYGEFTIGTGTLCERSNPFPIMVELARGTLNRLRNQISIWGEGGLEIPEVINEKVSTAISWLSKAIMHEDDVKSDEDATKALQLAFEGVFALSEAFGQQISRIRIEHEGMPNFWTAFNACSTVKVKDESVDRLQSFDLIEVDKPDGRLPNVDRNSIAGPMLDASVGGLDESIIGLDDFLSRRDHLLNRCRKTLESLPTSTSLIHVACGLNGMGHRHLSYPQQIEVTTELLRLIDRNAADVPTMVSFDFPWAERLASAVGGVHPLQIADSLLRQGEPISFIGLDVNLDYWPGGSVVRDPLQWVDMVDVWSQLGLPLVVCFRMPNGDHVPENAPDDRLVNDVRSNLNESQRTRLLQTVIPMLVARPTVHGFVWRQLSDSDDVRYPASGLVTNEGDAKPILSVFSQLLQSLKK